MSPYCFHDVLTYRADTAGEICDIRVGYTADKRFNRSAMRALMLEWVANAEVGEGGVFVRTEVPELVAEREALDE